jgi:hypothetical protein
VSYSSFKKAVFKSAGYCCEVPGHEDEPAETVHHFLKQSTYKKYREDPDNGMACSGRCHAEIERRQRTGEDWLFMYPMERYEAMLRKAGLWLVSPSS